MEAEIQDCEERTKEIKSVINNHGDVFSDQIDVDRKLYFDLNKVLKGMKEEIKGLDFEIEELDS